ncbi:MAG: hypothetical protein HGA85_08915 [Nanoarchaeota archaeon]|nr:hypothetical protein [Nanoarchaeota archaeon]
MTLMNLTEKYRQENNLSFFQRWKLNRTPDVYYATSLGEVEEKFAESPPRAIKGVNLATLVMVNLNMKKHADDITGTGDDIADMFLKEITKTHYLIRDHTGYEVLATWVPIDSREGKRYQASLGINEAAYVRVPKIYLLFSFDPDIPDLIGTSAGASEKGMPSYRVCSISDTKPNLRRPAAVSESALDFGFPGFQPI